MTFEHLVPSADISKCVLHGWAHFYGAAEVLGHLDELLFAGMFEFGELDLSALNEVELLV